MTQMISDTDVRNEMPWSNEITEGSIREEVESEQETEKERGD